LKTRIISSVVFFPLLLIFIFIGGDLLRAGLFLLSVTAMTEVYKAFFKEILPMNYISYTFLAIYYLFLEDIMQNFSMAFIFLFIILNLTYLVMKHTKVTPIDLAINIFVFFYAGMLMSSIYFTRELEYGNYLVWFIFISAWGCDTAAYFTGKAIGKNKLIPTLSPNKTVEGFVGGLLGAMIIGVLYAFYIVDMINISVNIVYFAAIVCGVSALFSQVGDLAASSIKRYTNLKDYGKIIPGHGGIMDRFDSILFTAPIIFFALTLVV